MKLKNIFALLIVLLIGSQIWYLTVVTSYPFLGIIVTKDQEKQWVIEAFDASSRQSPQALRKGDILVALDGTDPNEHATVIKWGVVEQVKKLEVLRDGTRIAVDVAGTDAIGHVDYVGFIGEAVSFIFALFVYNRIKNSRSSRILALLFILFGLIFMSLGANARGDSLGKLLVAVPLAIIPFVFLHFLIVFFNEKANISIPTRVLRIGYALITSFALLEASNFVSLPVAQFLHSPVGRNIAPLYFVLGIVIVFVKLANLYFRYRLERSYESTLIKTIWISLSISFLPLTLLTLLPLTLWGDEGRYVNPLYTGWFIMFFPASFAYLIVSKQLYDIHFVLRRISLAALISLLPSLLLIGGVVMLDPGLAADRLGVLFLFFVVVLSFVFYSTQYLTTKLEPILFPRKYVLQKALEKISQSLRSVFSFRELKDTVLVDIVGTLQTHGGAIAIKYPATLEIFGEGDIDTAEVDRLIAEGRDEHPFYSIFEISRQEDYTSYLIMTRKKTNTLLGLEESQWLALIISYLAVSLENVHLIRKLTTRLQQLAATIPNEEMARELHWFRKLMFELQEQERTRIATDLHDTTLQDLYFLKRRIMKVLDKYAYSPDDLAELNRIIGYIEIINMNLRQSCFELNPMFVKDASLIRAVQKLVKLETDVSGFELEFRVGGGAESLDALEYERKRHVFRLVQELVNNAKKHSQARKVYLELSVAGGFVRLTYEDDGVGFEPARIASGPSFTSGIGMEQMRTRVYSLNGQLEIDSERERGVSLRILFPLKEAISA